MFVCVHCSSYNEDIKQQETKEAAMVRAAESNSQPQRKQTHAAQNHPTSDYQRTHDVKNTKLNSGFRGMTKEI